MFRTKYLKDRAKQFLKGTVHSTPGPKQWSRNGAFDIRNETTGTLIGTLVCLDRNICSWGLKLLLYKAKLTSKQMFEILEKKIYIATASTKREKLVFCLREICIWIYRLVKFVTRFVFSETKLVVAKVYLLFEYYVVFLLYNVFMYILCKYCIYLVNI